MLLSKNVKIKWNSKIKKHYVDIGYEYTKMGDEFCVNVNDLTKGSHIEVDIECDYCHKIYQKHWNNYINENMNSTIHKDACNNCKTLKAKESNQLVYGCDNVFELEQTKQKILKTNIQKYGVDNPSKSEEIKEKIKKVNIEKYGCEYFTQTDEYKDYIYSYCMGNYGIPYMPQLNLTHKKGELSPRWKGGALRNGLFRKTYQYNDWHDEVLKRDNYTCQCCGNKSGNGHRVELNAHHIFNFADNVDKRHDIDNGICLCKKCHRDYHNMYGYRNTTQIQLDEFILNHGKKIC